jgi:ComF family protein
MQPQQVDSWRERLSGWVMPPRCVLCRGRGQPRAFDLCAACEADLPPLERPCPRCAQSREPRDAGGSDCAHCRGQALPHTGSLVPFVYAAPLDGILHSLKYDGALANARVLGILLGRAAILQKREATVDLLVPVPLHPLRLAERGFNQSVEIARFVSRCVRLPCEPQALARVRATASQVGLARVERERNVQGAFAQGSRVERLRGKRVALVDDVMTTGSTAFEAARALLACGAACVEIWAVARALQA